jgi:hypothetical protein
MNWTALISALPKVSADPLAILAYIILAAGWVIWVLRRRRSIDFLKSLALQPEKSRPGYAVAAGYSYDELAGLNPKDRLRVITRRYLLIAYVFTGIAVLLFLLSVLRVVPQYLELRNV